MARSPTSTGKPGKSLSSLNTVFRFALNYPGHLLGALAALVFAAAATSGIPYAFKLIIDNDKDFEKKQDEPPKDPKTWH